MEGTADLESKSGKKQLFFVIICGKNYPEAKTNTTTTTTDPLISPRKQRSFPRFLSQEDKRRTLVLIELGKAIIICHHPN
jgi:hypothetical protein